MPRTINPTTEIDQLVMDTEFRVYWVLLVGISEYENSTTMPSLPGVRQDIDRLKHTLEQHCCGRIGDIWDIRDHEATAAHIRSAIRELATRALRGDTVVIYLGGHGHESSGGSAPAVDGKTRYFLPHDAAWDTAGHKGFSRDELAELLRPIRSQQLLLLIDCCHSGGLARWPDVDRLQLEGQDFMVVATTGARTKAGESDSGSFYIPHFCDALTGRAGEIAPTGLVTAQQAHEYASTQVDQTTWASGHPQRPWLQRAGGEIVLTRVRCGQTPQQHPRRRIFMAESLPGDFVHRPEEFEQLVAHLVHGDRASPAAITTALRGAGGYGKTLLARAVCHDPRVSNAFPSGILWVTLGTNPNITARIADICAEIAGDRPGIEDVEHAANTLARVLDDGVYLLVIDDVWTSGHLRPFLRRGPNCARLVTTRLRDTVPPDALEVNVDQMREQQAVALLSARLPPGDPGLLGTLANDRLGRWPLLLHLVNARLRERIEQQGQTLDEAISYVNGALDQRGLTWLDDWSSEEREHAVSATIDLSLEVLPAAQRERFQELAVFDDDTDIPLPILARLWHRTGNLDRLETEDLCSRFDRLSLLARFDAGARFIRLHDVMRRYLRERVRHALASIHRHLIDAHRPLVSAGHVDTLESDWSRLPSREAYLWQHLCVHLVGAGAVDELRRLLLDFGWLRAKLDVTSAASLDTDLRILHGDCVLARVRGALRLSGHVLARDKLQLSAQLLGRLLDDRSSKIKALLKQTKAATSCPWLRPLTASLRPPGGPLLRTLEGHAGSVLAIDVSADGRLAVSGGSDRTIKVWDLESGEEIRALEGHTSWIRCIAVTPDGRLALSASDDLTVRVWDLDKGQPIRTLTGHTDWVRSVAVDCDGRLAVSGSSDGTLKMWDVALGLELCTVEAHTDAVRAVTIFADQALLASASDDHTLKVWDLENGREICTLDGHKDRVRAVRAVSVVESRQHRMISASDDRTVRIWEIEEASEVCLLEGHAGWVGAVAITPDGRRAVSGSFDRTLKVWDTVSGRELRTLDGHSDWINAVAITADGGRAVSASSDRTVKLWDLRGEDQASLDRAHYGSVTALAVTADGRYAVSASDDCTLRVWDMSRGHELRALAGHTDSIGALSLTPDGTRIVSASDDLTVRLWDLVHGGQLFQFDAHTNLILAMTVVADGRYAITASCDWTLRVWDLMNGELLSTLSGHKDWVRSVSVTADGRYAVSASDDRTLRVWDVHTGRELRELAHRGEVTFVAVTAGGHHAVLLSSERRLSIWDLAGGRELYQLGSHEGGAMTVAIAADGRRAIVPSMDGILRVWDLQTGDELRTLGGHETRIRAVAATTDGRRVVSASHDGTVKAWDTETGALIGTFTGDGAMRAVAVNADGRTVVAGDQLGSVHFLRLESEVAAEN